MPAYNLIVKGSAKEAIVAAERRNVRVLHIIAEKDDKTILVAEAFGRQKIEDIYRWFNAGPVDAPFPPGTLLHFSEREGDSASELEPRGTKLLDGLGEAWAVSTLKPGLHGRPAFRHVPDEASAIAYARERALHGPLARQGGRVYYVLEGENIVYRVLRGLRGQEKRPGGFAPEPRREFIVVQRAAEMLPGRPEDIRNIRWVWDHGLSIEIIDPELAKERARVVRPAAKSTRYAPGWAFKPPPKVRSK